MSSHVTSFLEREQRLAMLALQIATTYCNVAESHVVAGHRADSERVLLKARTEIASVERRLHNNKNLFEAQTGSVVEQIAKVKQRIDSLEGLAT